MKTPRLGNDKLKIK